MVTIKIIRPYCFGAKWPHGNRYPCLELRVREFVPGQAHVTSERWGSKENPTTLELPCFAADDYAAVTTALLQWVDNNFELYSRDMVTQGGDFLVGATFAEALRYVDHHPVCTLDYRMALSR